MFYFRCCPMRAVVHQQVCRQFQNTAPSQPQQTKIFLIYQASTRAPSHHFNLLSQLQSLSGSMEPFCHPIFYKIDSRLVFLVINHIVHYNEKGAGVRDMISDSLVYKGCTQEFLYKYKLVLLCNCIEIRAYTL